MKQINKNGGHFQLKTAYDPFQQLVVPEHGHILSWYSHRGGSLILCRSVQRVRNFMAEIFHRDT